MGLGSEGKAVSRQSVSGNKNLSMGTMENWGDGWKGKESSCFTVQRAGR